MKIRLTLLLITGLSIWNLSSANSLANQPNNSLLNMLTTQLGINDQQATNGISSLMNLVKQHLTTTDYTRLLAGAPDLATLSNSVSPPQIQSGFSQLLNYAGTLLGENSGLNDLIQLTQSFTQLGLSADMVGKFFKIALDYVQGTGGIELMNLLASAVKLQ